MNCLQIGSFLKRDIFPVPTIDRFDGVDIEQNWPGIILPLLNYCGVSGLDAFVCIFSVIPQD